MIIKIVSNNLPESTISIPPYLAAKAYFKGPLADVCVRDHCIAVGVVAQELIQKVLPRFVHKWVGENILSVFPFIVACHDIGKVSAGFQYMLRKKTIPHSDPTYPIDPQYGTLRHDVVSYEFLRNRFSDFFATMILYHHGYYRNGDYGTSYGTPVDSAWELERMKLFLELTQYFKCSDTSGYTLSSSNLTIKKYLTGLLVVSDFIASSEDFFPLSGFTVESIPRRVSNALGYYGFYSLGADSIKTVFSFEEIFENKSPYPMQKEMARLVDGPGLYIYEDQMGGGKTEGALFPAMELYRKGVVDGIYFGMPTQVTSNLILVRVKDALSKMLGEESSVRLLHSNADMLDDPKQEDWFRGNKKAILDEFGVGTVDQMLLGVLPNIKHFFLRTFGLCRKAIIIDEVHSYDVYTSGLLKALINDLIEMDCVVIVLSATLTEAAKKELLDAV